MLYGIYTTQDKYVYLFAHEVGVKGYIYKTTQKFEDNGHCKKQLQ